MAKSIWDEVQEIADTGGRPTVTLPRALEVIERHPRGRPRVIPVGAHPDYSARLKTPQGRRMRCRAAGCNKQLPRHTTNIVCSESCAEDLRKFCQACLAVLDGKEPVTSFPPYYCGRLQLSTRRSA